MNKIKLAETSTDAATLAKLAKDENVYVRGGVARNASTPKSSRGRPPKAAGAAASIRVAVYLTPAQLAAVDAARGKVTRSAYIVRNGVPRDGE